MWELIKVRPTLRSNATITFQVQCLDVLKWLDEEIMKWNIIYNNNKFPGTIKIKLNKT